MLWQTLIAIIITVVLGLSSLILKTTLSHRKMALTEFASHDYLEIAKGASAYVSYESSSLLKALKSFIYSTENSDDKLLDLELSFNNFNSEMNLSTSSKLAKFLDSYISHSTFINKFNLKAKTEFQEDLDLSHRFNLGRSDFLEIKNLDTVTNYKTSRITADKLSHYSSRLSSTNFNFDNNFIDSNNLLISEKLLRTLITDDSDYQLISANPENYNLKLNDYGLDISDFPNTLILETKYPVFEFDNKSEKEKQIKDIKFISTAQLDIVSDLELEVSVPDISKPSPRLPLLPVFETPETNDIVGERSLTNFDLGIRSLPAASHGIIVNPNKEVSADNPLRVVSAKSNGLSTFYIDEAGHIVMSIGKAFEGNSRLGLPDNFLNFNDEGVEVLDTYSENYGAQSLGSPDSLNDIHFNSDTSSSEIIEEKPSVVLDVLPRQHNRYGTVNESFNINGIEIPEGAVVVATRSGDAKYRINNNSNFNYFKVYDASGVLINKFHQSSIQSKKKLKNIDLQSFNTEKGFEDGDGSKIFQSFSTADLFEGQDSEEAVKSFLNIQADLADSLQLNINEKNKKWHKDLYRDFKAQGISYTGATLEVNDLEKAAELYIAEKAYVDEIAKDLDKEQFKALIELEGARERVDQAKA